MKILACEGRRPSSAATFDTGSLSLGGKNGVVAAKYLTRRCAPCRREGDKARKSEAKKRDPHSSLSSDGFPAAERLRRMQDDGMKVLAMEIYTSLEFEQKDGGVLTFGHLKPSLCIVLLLSSLANLVALTV